MKNETQRPRTLVLPPAPYAAAMVGGWWLDRHQAPLPLDWGVLARPLGWLLVAAGVLLFAWALLTLYRHHTTVNPYKGAHALCTDGPFHYSRNPIYLGDWLILAGVSALLHTWWPMLFAPLIWLLLRYGVIRHEEAHLESRFGDAYRHYKRRVRRWL
ncbi:MAG: isoprenylcysteine carboxylmethyltransferase family protein [Gammaproteobacteria bacterium]|nr:isoprenylcysteine carboxylmethyltransferase family protein [Gammaproteobacteria bacterium]MCP5416695.1 isoprenylcysteine carboxylmethyltransferase family protein [Chromatiaceae bacterium]